MRLTVFRRLVTGRARWCAVIVAVVAASQCAVPASARVPGGPADRGMYLAPAQLNGVAASSARGAWAVGGTDSGFALFVHWNGRRWQRVLGPRLGFGAFLSSVTAVSARTAWAVGSTSNGGILIAAWNGRRWARVTGAALRVRGVLSAVAATSAANAWAVGSTGSSQALIMRWNGTRWRRVSGPRLPRYSELRGVAASGGLAWAVGQADGNYILILNWNGHSWRQVRNPIESGGGDFLFAVTAVSPRDAWAVGVTGTCCAEALSVIVHWNGRTWH